ncbi:CFA_G0000870.mRNA.1.CDS.1 [Saccharomyces cerevisiae]|nr:CFA_G0000870.mRNA.1.CDS.1 [Saccharomyces cerevisiae]CAI7129421.1 CFA_G0000870.mRNA.1.CDS.1 [Saccharomyces cerevisiae]
MYSGTLVLSAARTSTFAKSSQCGNNHTSEICSKRYSSFCPNVYCRTPLSASEECRPIRHFRWGNSPAQSDLASAFLDLIHICSSTVDDAC